MEKFTGNKEDSKVNIGDIIFLILAVIFLLFLIPFYPSLLTIVKKGVAAEVGKDVYFCVFALMLSCGVMFLGFKFKNFFTKLTALGLIALFTFMPFREYLNKKSLFKETLSNYKFEGLTIVPPLECEPQKEMIEEIKKNGQEQFGESDFWGFEVETRPMPEDDATFKEKFECMPSKTTFKYIISYKDAYNVTRHIEYIDDDTYFETLKAESFSIALEYFVDLLKEHNLGNTKYWFYIVSPKKSPIALNRKTIISENLELPYPSRITLNNFTVDRRLLIELDFGMTPKTEDVKAFVKKLHETSDYPLNLITTHRQETEYYVRGELFNGTYEEFIQALR